jgi:hypothetical protein
MAAIAGLALVNRTAGADATEPTKCIRVAHDLTERQCQILQAVAGGRERPFANIPGVAGFEPATSTV